MRRRLVLLVSQSLLTLAQEALKNEDSVVVEPVPADDPPEFDIRDLMINPIDHFDRWRSYREEERRRQKELRLFGSRGFRPKNFGRIHTRPKKRVNQ